MSGIPNSAGSHRTPLRWGCLLLGLALVSALVLVGSVLLPAWQLAARAEIGSTVIAEVPGGRDWGVYTTVSGWRTAPCSVTGADGQQIELRSDMFQQRLYGRPSWHPQGSFQLDRRQPLTVTCVGPPGQFAIGPSAGIGAIVLRGGAGLLGVLLGASGVIMLVVAAVRRNRGR